MSIKVDKGKEAGSARGCYATGGNARQGVPKVRVTLTKVGQKNTAESNLPYNMQLAYSCSTMKGVGLGLFSKGKSIRYDPTI